MSPAEIGPLIVTIGVGFVILFLFLKANFLKNLTQKYRSKSAFFSKKIHTINWENQI